MATRSPINILSMYKIFRITLVCYLMFYVLLYIGIITPLCFTILPLRTTLVSIVVHNFLHKQGYTSGISIVVHNFLQKQGYTIWYKYSLLYTTTPTIFFLLSYNVVHNVVHNVLHS